MQEITKTSNVKIFRKAAAETNAIVVVIAKAGQSYTYTWQDGFQQRGGTYSGTVPKGKVYIAVTNADDSADLSKFWTVVRRIQKID